MLLFDNRDCGRSTLLEHVPPPNEVLLALKERVPFVNCPGPPAALWRP